MRRARWLAALALLGTVAPDIAHGASPVYTVEGDAIARPLTGRAGDPARGARLITDRHNSLCLLCHAGPFPDPHLHGTLAPSLAGVGARLSAGQLRLRIVDMKALNPTSIMPVYYRVAGEREARERRIADAWRDKPVLEAGEIEDLVAYLATLKEPNSPDKSRGL